jgi:hypothetical protein
LAGDGRLERPAFGSGGQISLRKNQCMLGTKKEKGLENHPSPYFYLVAGAGFEPATFGLWGQSICQFLHTPNLSWFLSAILGIFPSLF